MANKRWSAEVTERSDALDLSQGVFKLDDPGAIARSLKESAEHSQRRKAEPFRSGEEFAGAAAQNARASQG